MQQTGGLHCYQVRTYVLLQRRYTSCENTTIGLASRIVRNEASSADGIQLIVGIAFSYNDKRLLRFWELEFLYQKKNKCRTDSGAAETDVFFHALGSRVPV